MIRYPVARLSILLCSVSFAPAQPARGQARSPFHEQAVAESLVPIRPGIPGRVPFWNGHSRTFTYAPAFEFPEVKGAGAYRFDLRTHSGTFTFEADVPWAPLTPIWKEVPPGEAALVVSALDRKGGRPLGISGQRTFYRAAVFNGPYGQPALGYEESARLALRTIFHQPAMQSWLRQGKPDPGYPLNCYPAKVMGATVLGMTLYSKLAADPLEKQQALAIARRAADFLIALSLPDGPLAFFPPTYWAGVNPAKHPVHPDRVMTHYPSDAAFGYLDLYDATGDRKYFEAARRIAATYGDRQLPNGTWPLVVEVASGRAIGPNLLVPTWPISLMERLASQYGVTGYREVAARAFRWIEENPMRRFNWDAQFEDARPREPYVNLSREQACDVAVYLLDHRAQYPSAIEKAEELLRFAEDQFVVWENPGPDWAAIFHRREVSAWFTPAVLEQYTFYVPVARSIGILIGAYEKAYRATNKPIYLAKARSLANTMTLAQKHYGGEYPTLVSRTESSIWLNNTVYTARYMYEFGRAVPQF